MRSTSNPLFIISGDTPVEEYVKIASVENEVEAKILEGMLKERDIPHELKSYYDSALNGIYQLQKGWGYVSAPERYRRRIFQILHVLRGAPE